MVIMTTVVKALITLNAERRDYNTHTHTRQIGLVYMEPTTFYLSVAQLMSTVKVSPKR